jgi:hypothetical protein
MPNCVKDTQLPTGSHVPTTARMPRIKSAPLNLRVRPELKAALLELAQADRRSLSSYLELVLEQHVARTRAESGKPARTKA